jgi:transposase
MAKQLKCPVGAVNRCLKNIGDAAAYENLRWGAGRPLKVVPITAAQLQWITSRETLRAQVGKPLTARVRIANARFGLNMTLRDFRSIYRKARITVQKLSPLCKPARDITMVQQQMRIDELQEDFAFHMAQQKHMVQYDAAVFSVNQYSPKHWAPSGHPLKTAKKYYQSQLVCVWGAISVEEGWVHVEAQRKRALNTDDTIRYFKAIGRRRIQNDLVMFGDNAKTFNNRRVHDWAAANDIELLYNVPYRPEANGIEGVWRIAKTRYRAELARRLVNDEPVDNLALVQDILMHITDEECKKEAMQGWQRLVKLEPKDYSLERQ